MTKIFALLAVLLILSGALVLAVPRDGGSFPASRTSTPSAQSTRSPVSPLMGWVARARDIAEQVNAPLSILFGVVSLYYSRRRYVLERDSHGYGEKG